MKSGFVFYRSWLDSMSLMTEEERNELLWVILRMGLYNEEPKQMSRMVAISWSLIRTQMEVNNQRYENSIQRRQKQNESKTEAKQKQNESKTEAKQEQNESKTVAKEKVKEKEKEKEKDKGSVSDNFKNELLADQVFVEKFMMVKNCEPSQVKKQVDEFETWLTVKNQTHATFAEYKNHFWNWVALRNVQQKPHWTHTVKSEDLRYFEQHGELPDGTTPY